MGYGHRASTVQSALEIGAIDEGYDDPVSAVRDSELVILATPVGVFEKLLKEIAPALAPGTVVTDVGSTKRSVVMLAGQILPPQVHFVGSHPMAGSEKRGVEFARTDLFQNALCLLTPVEGTSPIALQRVESFWQALGMRTTHLSPEDHDRRLADISHLPHAVAAALVLMQEEASLHLCGKGFLDTTRIASGDGGLWRDIFQDNADNLKEGITRLTQTLNRLVELLDQEDAKSITEWLDQASRRRDNLLKRKLKELES